MFIALSSFLGLVLCFSWNDITANAACIKEEGWKPCGNENCYKRDLSNPRSIILGSWLSSSHHGDSLQHLTRTKD
ncbi:hypothetical protein SLE2022_322360 [Rubroshorea leprosula]